MINNIVFLLLIFSSSAFADSKLEKTISVTGVCKTNILPDRVSVTITIEELNKNQKISSERASEKYNKLLASVKKMKLKDAEYATTEYRVFPHKPWENRKQVFKGYKTRIGLKISTSEMDKSGKLLSLGNNLGQDFVSGPDSFVSDSLYNKNYRSCLKTAMGDALAKAKIIAKAASRKLGKVVAVSESQGAISTPRPMYKAARMEMMASDSKASAPSIQFGKDKISVRLSVFFDLD